MKNNTITKILFMTRAKLMRWLLPASSYWVATKSIEPLSRKFGFDRGTPIDRYWIESFLETNKQDITGVCLEIGSDLYTKKFGQHVTKADVLDIDKKNKNATIVGDLRNLSKTVNGNTYDCIILTHVIGLIDDLDAAVSEVKRALKPGGVVLVTVACLGPTPRGNVAYWRITPKGLRYLFEKHFSKENIHTKEYGNVLAGQYFWVGMAQEDLSLKDLSHADPEFPCIACLKAYKT